jgi:hypothetical protein
MVAQVTAFCEVNDIGLVVIGPEVRRPFRCGRLLASQFEKANAIICPHRPSQALLRAWDP